MRKKGKKGKKISPVYDPLKQLSGKRLRKFVEAITKLEYAPQEAAINQQIKSLKNQNTTTTNKLTALGNQANTNVRSYYNSLAQAEAANYANQQELARRSQQNTSSMTEQAANAIQNAGQAANTQLRQDSGARDELQAMIAEQQSRQAREAQAIKGNLENTSNNWLGLQQAMAATNQARGRENLTDINRQNNENITKATAAFNEEIAAALAKRAGLKGEAASAFIKNLYEARGAEREYSLGDRAIKSKNAYNKSQIKLQKMRNNQANRNNAAQMYIADRYSNAKIYASDRNAEVAALYANKQNTDRWREAYSMVRSDLRGKDAKGRSRAAVAANPKNKKYIIDGLIRKHSFSWGAANKAYNTWLKNYKKRRGYRKGGAFGPASDRHK